MWWKGAAATGVGLPGAQLGGEEGGQDGFPGGSLALLQTRQKLSTNYNSVSENQIYDGTKTGSYYSYFGDKCDDR